MFGTVALFYSAEVLSKQNPEKGVVKLPKCSRELLPEFAKSNSEFYVYGIACSFEWTPESLNRKRSTLQCHIAIQECLDYMPEYQKGETLSGLRNHRINRSRALCLCLNAIPSRGS